MHAQQMDRQQATLGKADRHDGTVFGNVLRHPIVDSHGCGERVAVEVFAGRHAIMEPGVRAWSERAGRLQRQRRAQ